MNDDDNNNKEIVDILTLAMEKISDAMHKRDIYAIVSELLKDLTKSEFAAFFLFDREGQLLFTDSESSVEIPMIKPKGLLGKSFLTKEAAIYNYMASEKDYTPEIDNPREQRLRSQLIVPIIDNGNLIAMVRVCRSIYSNKHFSNIEMDIIDALSDFLIEVAKKLKQENKNNYTISLNPRKLDEDMEKISEGYRGNKDINSTMLFLANTVHDIRTPSNSLYGFLEILGEYIEDPRLKEFIDNAKESASFINTLTDSILQQVKETHEITTSKPEVVNSIKFFAQLGDLFSANMCKKEINYSIYLCPDLPKEIRIDTLKVKRIIVNLIGNAYKFTPSSKTIKFSVVCNKETKEMNISVEDTGLGISKSRQKDIFKSFEQAEENTSEHFGGTGLGLAISSKYVQDMGGELELDSVLDEGSNFYFNLPIDKIISAPSQKRVSGLNAKILILTDESKNYHVKDIKDRLIDFGIKEKSIIISDQFSEDITHLFCFQHKVTTEILEKAKQNGIKYTLVEERLFSLSKDTLFASAPIISINTYYGAKMYSLIYSGKKIKILLADDNKINIVLLQAMLETEYCTIDKSLDGLETLDKLKIAKENNDPYNLIFLDDNMPNQSGSEVLATYREIEKSDKSKPIFAVSITGDPNMSEANKSLYDLKMNKPFKKEDVREAVKLAKESH